MTINARRHAITARERDAIVRALRENPGDVDAIAARFERSPYTVERLRAKAGVSIRKRKEQLAQALRNASAA